MLAGLIHAVAWAVVIAPLTGPDEDAHAAYVQHVAETGDSPQTASGHNGHSTQMELLLNDAQLRSMINNAGARPKLDDWNSLVAKLDATPHAQRADGDGPNAVAANPPLYYYTAAVAYRLSPGGSLPSRLLAVRVATALLMPVMVLLAWLIAAEFFSASWPRILTALLVAFQPKMAFMAGTINPDALMITFFTATLLASIRIARRGLSTRGVLILGLCAGGAVLSHGRGFAAVPVAVLAFLLGLQRTRPATRAWVQQAAILLAAIGIPALVAIVYTRSHNSLGAFGGELSEAGTNPLSVSGFSSYVWQFYLPPLDFMRPRPGVGVGYRQIFIDGFFGQQGGLDVNFGRSIYGVLQLGAGVGLVMLFVVVVRRFEELVARWREVLVLVGAAIFLMFLLHLSDYRDVSAGADALITGRYILPIVTLYGLAITFVCDSLPKRAQAILIGFVSVAAIVIALGALGNAVERLSA
jgi:4-amino-4-deoxy-L-arabinose transferase-like glycosyltransferase